jgi:hypothetical protein
LVFFCPSPERGGSARSAGEGSTCLCGPPPERFAFDLPLSGGGEFSCAGVSASSATASPSASLSACSSESASRVAMSGRTTSRSTTTSMSWVNFLSSAGASAIS